MCTRGGRRRDNCDIVGATVAPTGRRIRVAPIHTISVNQKAPSVQMTYLWHDLVSSLLSEWRTKRTACYDHHCSSSNCYQNTMDDNIKKSKLWYKHKLYYSVINSCSYEGSQSREVQVSHKHQNINTLYWPNKTRNLKTLLSLTLFKICKCIWKFLLLLPFGTSSCIIKGFVHGSPFNAL